MNETQPSTFTTYASLGSAVAIIAGFFAPWVQWLEVPVSAQDMATGNFYSISETNFAITNPFPGMEFLNGIFWLMPALSVVAILFILLRKSYAGIYGVLSGAMVLGLALVYVLFTNELKLFDNKITLATAIQPALYVVVAAAIVLILSSWKYKRILKTLFIVVPLIVSFVAFAQIKESQVSEKTAATNTLEVSSTKEALQLINEFVTADSLSNATYREQVMVVEGIVTELNATDSTATLSMADSTGSYVIFDFEKAAAKDVQIIKAGDKVSVKGVCSGSIYSDILETQTISFKQSIIYKKQ